MKHIDLFSGIGGFALAADTVFENVEHIFCDNDKFCQAVLKKHWPNSKIYGDIRELITDTGSEKQRGVSANERENLSALGGGCDILTGGFPCQPFSQAGRRKGTADDRYLWPQMLRVIQLTKPTWVIAENVRGLVTWNNGMVLEQVCTDLEAEGYDVQPIVIPAVAVNALHRRDRIWFVANKRSARLEEKGAKQQATRIGRENNFDTTNTTSNRRERGGQTVQIEKGHAKESEYAGELAGGLEGPYSDAADTRCERRKTGAHKSLRSESQEPKRQDSSFSSWERHWPQVATELCSVDDGLPVELDGLKLSKAGHRREQLKAYGNAIVPQVAIEIMRAILFTTPPIDMIEDSTNNQKHPEHICRFNDFPQECECFNAGYEKGKASQIQEKLIKN